jgi:hypothetical protein
MNPIIFVVLGVVSMVIGFKLGKRFGALISGSISSPISGWLSVAILLFIIFFLAPLIGRIGLGVFVKNADVMADQLINKLEIPLSLSIIMMLIFGVTTFGIGTLGGRPEPKKTTNISDNNEDNSG